MPSLYAPMSGINTKQKSIWGLMSGVNTKMKNGYGLMSGVNKKIFSGIIEWTYALSGNEYVSDYASGSYSLYIAFKLGGGTPLKWAQVKFNFSSPVPITKFEFYSKPNMTEAYTYDVYCDDVLVKSVSQHVVADKEYTYSSDYSATIQSITFKISYAQAGNAVVNNNFYIYVNGVRILLSGNGVINI